MHEELNDRCTLQNINKMSNQTTLATFSKYYFDKDGFRNSIEGDDGQELTWRETYDRLKGDFRTEKYVTVFIQY